MTESIIDFSTKPTKASKRLSLISRAYNTIVIRSKSLIYAFLEKKIQDKKRIGKSADIIELKTFFRNFYFINNTEMITAVLKHQRLGAGQYFGEGRQLLVVAEALGRHRVSKNAQDAKQKRSILAQLLSQSDKHIPKIQNITKALLDKWQLNNNQAFSVNDDLKRFTLDVYLQSVFGFQGDVKTLIPIADKQINLLSRKFAYKFVYRFKYRFKRLRAKLVSYLGSDKGLMTTTKYLDKLQEYIGKHYRDIKDDAFATGLNSAVLAGYLAPYPAFVSLIYELGKNPNYQNRLRDERHKLQQQDHEFSNYIQREDTLLHATIHEVLRLHPSQPFVFRSTTENLTIGNVDIPRNSEVVCDFYHAQGNATIWGGDPKTFKPERFLENAKLYKEPFFAYSAGPNNCTGQFFSRYCLKVLLAELITQFQWKISNGERRHIFSFALEFDDEVEIMLTPLQ